jgi:hypothetical protein
MAVHVPGRKRMGRPAVTDEVRTLAYHTRENIIKVLVSFLELSREQLAEKMQAAETTMLELLVGSIITRGIKDGDPHRMNAILDRIIGRASPDAIVIADNSSSPVRALVDLVPREKLYALIEEHERLNALEVR